MNVQILPKDVAILTLAVALVPARKLDKHCHGKFNDGINLVPTERLS